VRHRVAVKSKYLSVCIYKVIIVIMEAVSVRLSWESQRRRIVTVGNLFLSR
jgi:hypothetical protein